MRLRKFSHISTRSKFVHRSDERHDTTRLTYVYMLNEYCDTYVNWGYYITHWIVRY